MSWLIGLFGGSNGTDDPDSAGGSNGADDPDGGDESDSDSGSDNGDGSGNGDGSDGADSSDSGDPDAPDDDGGGSGGGGGQIPYGPSAEGEECDRECQAALDEIYVGFGGGCPSGVPHSGDNCLHGLCGAICASDASCAEGFTCQNGECQNDAICDLPFFDTDQADDVCAGHGGTKWQGQVCLCSGLIDLVTICQDDYKIDTVTAVTCTPNPAVCQPGANSGGAGGNGGDNGGGNQFPDIYIPFCGNGIVDPGEQCDGSNDHCGPTNQLCTNVCTCELQN